MMLHQYWLRSIKCKASRVIGSKIPGVRIIVGKPVEFFKEKTHWFAFILNKDYDPKVFSEEIFRCVAPPFAAVKNVIFHQDRIHIYIKYDSMGWESAIKFYND